MASVNDLTDQMANITIQAYNAVTQNPSYQYPDSLLKASTELANQREKLMRFNQGEKLGWVYLLSMGQVIAELPVMGKVSSTQSQMTASTGVYLPGNYNAVTVELPSDDLSFGPNEGGDHGVFFFTVDGVMIEWCGDWLYADAQLKMLSNQVLQYQKGSVPSSTSKS